MKNLKYLVLLLPIFLTGCFGLNGKGVLTNECVKEEITPWMTEKDKYVITYKEGKISEIEITNEYEGLDMSSSIDTSKKAYENEKGVTITTDNSKITYKFDMNKVNSNIKEAFNLKDNYNDQVKILTDKGYTCD